MKKFSAILMIIILFVSIVGCSNNSNTDALNALNNTAWKISIKTLSTSYDFKDDIIIAKSAMQGLQLGEDKGRYSLVNDCIKIDWDNPDCGRVTELYYSFENDTIKLFADEAKQSEISRLR